MLRYWRLLLHLSLVMAALLSMAQSQECLVTFPSQYAYKTSALQNPSVDDDANCTENTIDGTDYTICAHPIIVTDNNLGPQEYSSEDDSYYLWNRAEDCQVLFTFPQEVEITMVQFHFYIHRNESIGLPKLRLSLVDSDFGVSDTLDPSVNSLTVDPIDVPIELNELRTSTLELSGDSTRQVLLRIDESKRYGLALTEIKFCTEGSSTSASVPTLSSSQTPSVDMSTSSPPPSTVTVDPTSTDPLLVMSTSASHKNVLSLLSLCTLVIVVLLVLR